LGGGADFHADRSALARIGHSSRARLAEGIRLLRVLPDAKLITSGSGQADLPTMSQEAEQAALSLGVAVERIIRFDDARDTREEIRALKKQVGDAPVALVTSAFHLPRAMALCKEMRVNAIPCPSDYWSGPAPLSFWAFFRWSGGGLSNSAFCFHEWLGRLAA
jgi:uncharacterized SAM-binding protein YcdF (DUF218 family)